MKLDLDKITMSLNSLDDAKQVVGELVKIIKELQKKNDELQEQLNTNSKNSSLPPSSDKKKEKLIKPKTGRNRGGQPGHQASQRKIIPSDQVDQIIECKPDIECKCGGSIVIDSKFQQHQVFEIPIPKFEVNEYRIFNGYCDACHDTYKGNLPTGITWKGFGVRAQAMVSLLTSKYRLSKRLVQAWFKDVYQMPICIGSVSNVENTVSQSLASLHEELGNAVKITKIVHIDETGHKECNKNAWMWLMSTSQYTYFKLDKSRGKKVAKELIGDFSNRIIVTDRYAAYDYLPNRNHQVCWAHLKRDFQKISERDGSAGRIGSKLLKVYEQIFCLWKTELQDDKPILKKQRKRIRYLKTKMHKWLYAGMLCKHAKTARTCENILEFSESLWNFLTVKDVSPTNNHAERQLRPLVISKKLTFGTQSKRGSRFIERIFTVVMTCKQQGIDTLTFLINSVEKYFRKEEAPSLVISN